MDCAKTKIIALVVFLTGVFTASAAVEDEMNAIKTNPEYIYGEAYIEDSQGAYQEALGNLVLDCNIFRESKGLAPLKAKHIIPLTEQLEQHLDGVYNTLVYLTKDKVLKIKVENAPIPTPLPAAAPQPLPLPLPQPQPVVTSPEPQTAGQPDEQPQSALQPVVPTTQPGGVNTAVPMISQQVDPDSQDVNTTLAMMNTLLELKPVVKYFKQLGKITQNGNTMSLSDVPSDANVILFDGLRGVLAVLSPSGTSPQINYKSGKPDSPANYAYKFIIWYK